MGIGKGSFAGSNKPLRLRLLCIAMLAWMQSHVHVVQIRVAYHNDRHGLYHIQACSVAAVTVAGFGGP